jgi:hypothetical protein
MLDPVAAIELASAAVTVVTSLNTYYGRVRKADAQDLRQELMFLADPLNDGQDLFERNPELLE